MHMRRSAGKKQIRTWGLRLLCTLTALCLAGCTLPGSAGDNAGVSGARPDGTPAIREEIGTPAEAATMQFLDVGKADCAIVCIGEYTAVIDTGTQDNYDDIAAALRSSGATRIDALVLSHLHKDHMGSAAALIADFEVGRVLLGPHPLENKRTDELMDAMEAAGITPVYTAAGDVFNFGGAAFEILGPRSESYEQENDYSMVARLTVAGQRVLFTGDIENDAIKELLASGEDLSAEILKVPHHGREEKRSGLFFTAVSPQYAVISSSYDAEDDLPSGEVVSLLHTAGSEVFVTADGTVTAQLTRDGVSVMQPGA